MIWFLTEFKLTFGILFEMIKISQTIHKPFSTEYEPLMWRSQQLNELKSEYNV